MVFSCLKTLIHVFRRLASTQSNQSVNTIHSSVNDNRGVDFTEAQREETSGPPMENDIIRSLTAGSLNPNLEDSAYYPVSASKPGEAIGADWMRFSDPTDNTVSAYQRRYPSRAATPP